MSAGPRTLERLAGMAAAAWQGAFHRVETARSHLRDPARAGPSDSGYVQNGVDLHFHLLPGLGPEELADSVELAEAAVGDGTGIVVATPHAAATTSRTSPRFPRASPRCATSCAARAFRSRSAAAASSATTWSAASTSTSWS